MSTAQGIIVWCSVPDQASANTLSQRLVEQKLAACVHTLPQGRSTYRWLGKVEHQSEHLLMIKSHPRCETALIEAICANHPYEVPEIILTRIDAGLPAYMQWLAQSVEQNPLSPEQEP
ncbi:CutA1 divalent ion tolerance protein [Magnetococcus marinus MC-1]|uniref:CutA1 divalent ion tolerance protein n=1 Tax=Magnetococcus marinus (strain ATCC BAA-1437 / JCM 17883 / MC-1) TaxID=156889 RepID=A0L478_MAGMM|nr:divalent-cation tolerance protein CutA [Magnetococcus marinus]ABK42771.1 CutA1 divalent ion tolerance protein [Magnetococcus marinus MC-1]